MISKVLERSAPLTTLNPSAGYTTIINTYSVNSEKAEELLDLLTRSTLETLRHVPGFISANFWLIPDSTQVVNYAQWINRESIAAAASDPKVESLVREVAGLVNRFAPVLYIFRESIAAAA